MDPRTEAALAEIIRRIVEAVHPDQIILFGSQARGDAGPDSDVDLLVVAPSDEPPHRRVVCLYRATRGSACPKISSGIHRRSSPCAARA